MQTVLRVGPYRFVFYPHDVMHEPPHVHVKRDREEVKFWLIPVDLEWNRGYPGHELREIEELIHEHHEQLMEA